MSHCAGCANSGTCSPDAQANCGVQNNEHNEIGKVICVMSGKGGVGKSTVSVLLARALKRAGYSVGVLDADITGPSMPRLMGLVDAKVENGMFGLLPPEDKYGIPVMSINFLLESEDQPVLWRGPVISGVIKQFWTDVFWGKQDFIVVDLPPGTGDAAITVMQSMPVSGIVLVSLADEMVTMIVKKALNMARTVQVPVLGVVQNMTHVTAPASGERVPLYDDPAARDAMAAEGVPLIAELPFIKGVAEGNAEADAAMDICAQYLGALNGPSKD